MTYKEFKMKKMHESVEKDDFDRKYHKDSFAFEDTEGKIHTFDMVRIGPSRILLDDKYHLIVKGDDLLGELRWRLERLEKVVLILGISVLALAAAVLLIVL